MVPLDDADAWIFDLEGVLTDTARLHQRAWSDLFGGLFASLEHEGAAPAAAPFTADDYRRFVDGEAPRDGLRNVLADRGIMLPEGSADDPPGTRSVLALANDKDRRYVDLLASEGPGAFPTSVSLLHQLRAAGIDIAVVSASRHCAQVLEAAGLTPLVDVRVDGETAEAMGLTGKPDPALFTEAARRLGVEPARAVVVEDALAGVEAGRRGRFAVVVGVDRGGSAEALRRGGAHLVVADLGDLVLTGVGPGQSPWWLTFEDPRPSGEGTLEALCTLANGYLGTRGARPWVSDDGVHYPGTYIAGLYDRLQSRVGDQTVEVESLVNVPNWLPVTFRMADGPWLGTEDGPEVVSHRVRIDLRGGLLLRRCVVADPTGRRCAVVERRMVSMADPHLLAIELSCMPLNWTGSLQLRASFDSAVLDDETIEDRLLTNRHLELVDQGSDDAGELWLRVRTVQSQTTVALAARCRSTAPVADGLWTQGERPGSPEVRLGMDVSCGARVTVQKVVAVFTSRDRAISEPQLAASQAVADDPDFDALLLAHREAWANLWRRAAITVDDALGSSAVVNTHLFHLLQVASPHIIDLDVGMGARGLHGEGYRGHVFWDTLFAFPVLNLRWPQVSRALLDYRSRRLPAARRAARPGRSPGGHVPLAER